MGITIIDYSQVYFEELLNEAIPSKRGGKFVVMVCGSQRFAVFSPAELSKYHANIVERFLMRHGVRGNYNPKGDDFSFGSEKWSVEGGGHWYLDMDEDFIELWGNSQIYGSLDLGALAKELSQSKGFDGIATVKTK